MSRIVRKSNFDLDWYNEIFVLGELPEDAANAACEELNRMWTGESLYYYKVVDNNYILYKGMQP